MSNLIELLNSPTVESITNLSKIAAARKQEAAYNLFTLSSYNNHLENFHSDVIASLLDPDGLHKESGMPLQKFIEFLNKDYGLGIAAGDFIQSTVHRENGRLDIWIKDRNSGKNIVIENKINDAGDMDNQLTRYYDHIIRNGHGKVSAMIYLSLNGLKKAPDTSNEVSQLTKDIAAFTDSQNDLVNGWLVPTREACTNENSRSLIHQYIKLIQQLAHTSMDSQMQQAFYEFINSEEKLNAIKLLINLSGQLPTYRRDQFHKKITDHTPFKNIYAYQGYGNRSTLFMNYTSDGYTFKLDVWFNEDGGANVWFWIPSHREQNPEEGFEALTKKLTAVNFLDEFKESELTYTKYFTLNDYPSIPEIDGEILIFVHSFFQALKANS